MFRNKNGMSILEVVIGFGLLGILSLAFMNMMDGQNKQLQYFQNKSSLNEAKNFVGEAFSKTSICDWQMASVQTGQNLNLNNKKPDGVTLVSEINFNKIYSGANTGSTVLAEVNANLSDTTLKVSSIKLANLKAVSMDTYEGDLRIKFQSLSNQMAYSDLVVRKLVKVNASSPSNAPIVSCYSGQNLRIIGSGSIQSTASDCGNVICKNINFNPGCPVSSMISSGSVLYPVGGGSWAHYSYFFRFMNTAGTGQFCWDTGGDYNGCYGTEQFSWVVYCRD